MKEIFIKSIQDGLSKISSKRLTIFYFSLLVGIIVIFSLVFIGLSIFKEVEIKDGGKEMFNTILTIVLPALLSAIFALSGVNGWQDVMNNKIKPNINRVIEKINEEEK